MKHKASGERKEKVCKQKLLIKIKLNDIDWSVDYLPIISAWCNPQPSDDPDGSKSKARKDAQCCEMR